MSSWRVEITGLQEAIAAFGKSPIPIITSFFDSRVMPVVLAITRRETPKKTGALAESQYISKIGDLHWAIIEQEKYGLWIREGVDYTGTIYPLRPAYALYWENIEGGQPVSWAQWPGITQNDYGEKAARESMSAISSILSALITDMKKEYSF